MICPHCLYRHGTPMPLTRVNANTPLDLSGPAWSCPCCSYQASLDLRALQEPGQHTRPDELRPCQCWQKGEQER